MFKTDTHGWLEGHLKEQNYGADWGDFVSFSTHMQHKAGNLGVDLLLVDTGKLNSYSRFFLGSIFINQITFLREVLTTNGFHVCVCRRKDSSCFGLEERLI